jgi:hypothetical protein
MRFQPNDEMVSQDGLAIRWSDCNAFDLRGERRYVG